MSAYQDQRRELAALLRTTLPPERATRIESLIRDTIAITPRKAKKADAEVGASRLGGCPDLPPGMPWPTKPNGAVSFVGQLRLDELAPLDVHRKLPQHGLLSFFHGFLTNGEYEAEAYVHHFPDLHALTPRDPPARRRPRPTGVDFAPLALLPPHSSPLVPLEGVGDPYAELFDTRYRMYDGELSFHGLFGFDRPHEGEQRAGEDLLLRLDAPDAPYDFVEAVCAYYFIPRDALAHLDFSAVRLHEGASI